MHKLTRGDKMFRRLLLVVILATATMPWAQAQADAQSAESLAGVRAKIAQLRAELQMNRAAMAAGGLPADEQATLKARANQITAEINALLEQERALTRK